MQKKILIVDDVISNRFILTEMLKRDYAILEASSGEEALAVINDKHEVISAVLLDIIMPGIDGLEVLRRIRADAVFSQMPVIMVTESEDEESRIKALSLGANDYVMKPYSSDIIKHCLKNNIAFREAALTVNILEKDRLTGIWNREAFFERAALEIERKPAGHYILACTDIEGFKIINDQYGNDFGDKILKTVGEGLNKSCQECDGLCGRIFADQFVCLYPYKAFESDDMDFKALEAKVFENTGIDVIFSVGRYIIEDKALGINAMFDRASIAKNTIKGRYDTHAAVYDESMRNRIVNEQKIVNDMYAALDGKQFEVWFQPQYNHSTGAMMGAEALVRWRHPKRGLIPPNDFIPIFERNGFIYDMDKFVWEETCRCLRKWLDEGRCPLPVSVNISRYDILSPDLIDTITGLIKKYELARDMLRIEITETAFTKSSQHIVEVVTELVDEGLTVEIDDFGSGYSSLNILKDVPAQIIKLDMKFLQSSNDSLRGGNILESVVRMAKWLDMSVIAEGIETVEQADYLRSIGCNYMQGYLYAKPMTVENYEAHCKGAGKEERLLALKTVKNLDNNAFWDPKSMDTLIFNSYVGAASIFELNKEKIEVIRSTEKYAEMISGGAMSVEDTLRLDWSAYLDEENKQLFNDAIRDSKEKNRDITVELMYKGLPGCHERTYIRTTMRVIATTESRCLVYNLVENVTSRREAEQEIKDAAAQIRSMMSDMPGGFVRLQLCENNKLVPVYINDGMVSLTGMSRDELIEMYDRDVYARVHTDDIAVLDDLITKMYENGEAHSARYRFMHGNGEYIWLSISGRVTKDASGNTFLNLYYTDASAQAAEEETQRALLDNLPCGAGVYELEDGQMSLSYQNKSYWELVGLYEADFPDPTPMSAVYPDDIPVIMQELSLAIEQQRDVVCNIRLRHLTEGYQPVRLVGRIVSKEEGRFLIFATFTPNNTQSLSYQQMLPVVMSAIMESTSDLSFAKDTSFRYLTSSRAFANMAGQKSETDVIGKTDYDLFNKELADNFRRDDEAVLRSGKSIVDKTEVIPSEDGSQHYSSTSKYILRDDSGDVIGLYGVGRDITKTIVQDTRLKLVNDNIPGGIATYSFRDNVIRITYCNDGFCSLFGGTRKGFEQRGDFDPIDWVCAEDQKNLLNRITALVYENIPLDFVYRVHIIDGGYKWIHQKAATAERCGDTVFFNAVLLDVTEYQNSNEQLRISEEENNLAVQHGGSIVCRYDVGEKSLTVSPSIAETYAIPEKIIDVPYEPVRLGLISPESADAYIGFFEAILNGSKAGTVMYQQSYFGDWRWMEAKSSTIFSDDGKPVKAVISLFDVTERLEKETIYKKWQHSLEDRAPDSYTLFRCNLNRNTSYETKEGTLFFFDIDVDDADLSFNERAKLYVETCVYKDDRDYYIAFLNSDTMLAGYYRGKRSDSLDYRELTPDGSVRWIRLTVDLVESPNSTDVEAYLMYENVDKMKKAELQTKELSETDPLTGILNRNAFVSKANQILYNSQPGKRHALLMLDIDGFKRVNDVFGHAAGDRALIDIANGLRSVMRHDDLVARLGGDEFVVFLANIQEVSSVVAKAKQIRTLAHVSFSREVRISASVGIAFFPRDGMNFESLYKKADSALYYVKGSGKDSQAVYSDSMTDEHLEPEPDTFVDDGTVLAEKKRRMLIVDDNDIAHEMLQNIFEKDFIIERANDGNTALVRMRHYGGAISVVLLDLMMPGMDGFAVLEEMQKSSELRSVPVIIVSGDESRETCLNAIRKGATDFVTKPVDADILRIRVHSAVSKTENQRLRAKNSLLEIQSQERLRYESYLETPGVTFIDYDRITDEFSYYPSVSKYLSGTYDDRKLWEILISDMEADKKVVEDMEQLLYRIAENPDETEESIIVTLKTPLNNMHRFRMSVRRTVNEYQPANRLIVSLVDLDHA